MRRRRNEFSLAAGLLALATAFAGAAVAAPYQNWYPADIKPPAGTQYPCALTALPLSLQGIPQSDKRFINHVYAMILKMTQAKLVMLQHIGTGQGLDGAYHHYYYAMSGALDKIRKEPTPPGLESFRNDVIKAGNLQVSFFRKAKEARNKGQSYRSVFNIPEGRQASGLLIAAWGKMAGRYKSWPAATKDSIYHHLCALDLF